MILYRIWAGLSGEVLLVLDELIQASVVVGWASAGLAGLDGGRFSGGDSSLPVWSPILQRLAGLAHMCIQGSRGRGQDPLRPGFQIVVQPFMYCWPKQVTEQSRLKGQGNRLHIMMGERHLISEAVKTCDHFFFFQLTTFALVHVLWTKVN